MREIIAPVGENPLGKMVIRGDRITAVGGVIDPLVFQSPWIGVAYQ
jgi:hypothetical protein